MLYPSQTIIPLHQIAHKLPNFSLRINKNTFVRDVNMQLFNKALAA